MRRTASLFFALVLVLVGGLVGCGGGEVAGSDATGWVDDVCARMTALDHEVVAERTDLDAQIGAGAEPEAMLSALDHFLGEVSGFVNLAGDDIARLGVPALDGDSPSRLYRDIETLFKTSESETDALQTSVKRVLRDTGGITDQAGSLVDEASALTNLDNEMRLILTDYRQLESAFEDTPNCQRWVDQLDTPSTTTPATTVEPTTTTTPPTTVPPTTVPPTTVPPPTVPPTEAPTTVPVTVDPFVSARDQYQAAADEYNPRWDLLWSTYYGEDDFILYKDAPAYCTEYAALEREWNARMSAIPWPADAQDEANIHITEGQILIGMLDLCAASPGTKAGVDATLTDIEAEEDTYYVTVDSLRVAIGLASLGG